MRDTFYKWMEHDAEFKKEMDTYKRNLVQMAEDVLTKALKADDKETARFVLRTLGKKVYGDNIDITSGGDSITKIKIEFIDGAKPEGDATV